MLRRRATRASASTRTCCRGLFEPFTQADRSLDRSKGGLGLGLSLVKGLVELHGGKVAGLQRRAGPGPEFIVRLPLDSPSRRRCPSRVREPRPPKERLRMLVVEDNRDAADSLRMLLELFGHEVRGGVHGAGRRARRRRSGGRTSCCATSACPAWTATAWPANCGSNPATAKARLIAVTGYGSDDDRRRPARGRLRRPPGQARRPGRVATTAGRAELIPWASRRTMSPPLAGDGVDGTIDEERAKGVSPGSHGTARRGGRRA